jgi:4-amino-4-deoxy-L-arabinose transferase-like glycosyltransferase
MTAITAAGRVPHLRLLQALVAFFVLLRVLYVFFAGPSSDEAYYWLWGQHPGPSYYDHAPLHGWLLGLSDLIFGRSLFGLRWMTLATLGGTAWIFRLCAERYAGADWPRWFWPGMVILLASPTFGIFSALAFHDYMLVFLVLVSAYVFLVFFTDTVTQGRGRTRDLLVAAVLLGCAGLTKYNGVFLGLGVVATVIAYRPLRPLFRDWRMYAAAAIAIAMQTPVLYWNATQNFASFRFHFSDRQTGGWLTLNPMTLIEFIVVSLVLVSPFVIWAMVRFFLSKPDWPFEKNARVLAAWTFALSTAVFLVISLSNTSWWWWNVVAYVVALPFLAKYLSGWAFWAHAAYGAILAVFLLVSSAVFPVLIAFGIPDNFRVNLYGWEQIEAPVEAAVAQYHPDFVAGESPEFASVMAFAMDNPDVRALTFRPNQINYWWDRETFRGKSAIVVIDQTRSLADFQNQFATVTPIGDEVPVVRFGREINRYKLYLAEGYAPHP